MKQIIVNKLKAILQAWQVDPWIIENSILYWMLCLFYKPIHINVELSFNYSVHDLGIVMVIRRKG